MKLYVIRHGLTKCNVENKYNGNLDEDINEEGIKQAIKMSEYVKDLNIDFIICSPMKRTKHTCRLINVNHLDVFYDDRIIERDCGILTGQDLGDFYDTDYWNYYSEKEVEGLETIKDLFQRVHLFIDEIKEKYKDKNVLLVTHGGVARAVYFYFHEIPEDGKIAAFGSENCEVKEYEL